MSALLQRGYGPSQTRQHLIQSSMLLRAARGDTNLILMGVASAIPLILARPHTIVSVQLSRLGGWPCSRQHRAARVHATRAREATPRGKHACEQLRACLEVEQLRACLEVDARLQMARAAYASSLLSRCERTYTLRRLLQIRWWALIGTAITTRAQHICISASAGACVIELFVGIAVGSCCGG